MRRAVFAVLVLLPLFASAETFDEVRVYATGGKSMTNWHGQADMQGVHFELGHAFSRRTTVAMVIAPLNVWQPRSWFGNLYNDGSENVRALSTAVLVRRSYRPRHRTQWFVEASSGPMVAEKRIPANTSHFNFASSASIGLTFNSYSRFPIIAGYRFTHISNGGYAPRNPGLNISQIVFGVQVKTSLRHRE